MRTTGREVRVLLTKLDGQAADALESETVEFKPWDPESARRKDQLREVRETVVCLANARGGTIVLGVQDRKRTRKEALTGVGNLQVDSLRKAIYDGTDPHLLVDCEELVEREGRLLLLHVPKGLGVHTTTEGVAKVRVGKDCQPLTGSMLAQRLSTATDVDRTAQTLDGATIADLDPAFLDDFRRLLVNEGRKPELARLESRELLESIGLVRGDEITLAAVLLAGRPPAMARWAPQHEVVFLRYASRTRYDQRHNLDGPILGVLRTLQSLLEAHLKIRTLEAEGFRELALPDLTWWVAREAVLNAIVHRDYFLRQSVYVEIRSGRVEVTSPGGFVGGVTPENILRHAPVRRNPLLANAFEATGHVNRAGVGVDRIYEELLKTGKALPRFEADESMVRLVLPTESQPAFARFVEDEKQKGRALELDDLILLRTMTERGQLDRWSAAEFLQCSEDDAAERLVALRERGYLIPRGRGRGTSYLFAKVLSDRLRGALATDDLLALDEEAVRLRVQAVLAERGRLKNADVRRITGYSRSETLRLIRGLQADGLARIRGRGRAAHYVPGPKLRPSKVPRRRATGERRRND